MFKAVAIVHSSSGLEAESSSPLYPHRGMGLDPSGKTATFLQWQSLALPVLTYTAASASLRKVHASQPAPPSMGYTYQ